MLRRVPAALVGLLVAGCACRPCRPCPPGTGAAWSGAPPAVALPTLPAPAPAVVEPLSSKPAPPTPAERLAQVAKAPDPVGALLALAREAPEILRSAPSDAFAPLLSDRVRLVDLRDVEREGGDAPPYAPGPLGSAFEAADDGVDPRVARIAKGVRDALGEDAWGEGEALLLTRRWGLLVVQAPGRWIDVEKALDRLAVAGGPSARVAALVSEDAAALSKAVGLEDGGWERTDARAPEVPGLEAYLTNESAGADGFFPPRWRPDPPSLEAPPVPAPPALESWGIADLDRAAWTRAEAVAAVPPLRVPLTWSRRVAAGRTSRTTYVRDLGPATSSSDIPVTIDALVAGTTLRGWGNVAGWRIDLVRARVVQPMEVFESRISSNAPALRIELPELKVARFGADLAPRAGRAALVRESGGAGMACLFRVEEQEEGVPVHPAWRWWKPPPPAPFGRRREYGWPVSVRVERLAADGAPSSVVVAPRLLLTEGSEGLVTIQEEETFVAGARASVPGRPRVADPVVGLLVTGLSIRAKVLPSIDGSVAVDGVLRIEDRDRPMRTFRAVGSSPAPATSLWRALTVPLPRTWRTDVPFRVRLRPRETVDLPASVRTSTGHEDLRLRLTLGDPVRLFTPWLREDPRR